CTTCVYHTATTAAPPSARTQLLDPRPVQLLEPLEMKVALLVEEVPQALDALVGEPAAAPDQSAGVGGVQLLVEADGKRLPHGRTIGFTLRSSLPILLSEDPVLANERGPSAGAPHPLVS